MTNSLPNSLGRYIYALASIAFGICAFIWHDVNALNSIHNRHALVLIVATLEILGGIAILFPRTTRYGALTLSILYLAIGLVFVPFVVHHPGVWNNWAAVFYQLSLAVGGLILFAQAASQPILARVATYTFALCNISFALEQYVYLHETAVLVPHWIPPSQMFWAWATTIFFALAGIALLTGILARLAVQLDTAMLILFALLSWVPVLIASPHSFFNWSETAETMVIAASSWVVADYLRSRRLN